MDGGWRKLVGVAAFHIARARSPSYARCGDGSQQPAQAESFLAPTIYTGARTPCAKNINWCLNGNQTVKRRACIPPNVTLAAHPQRTGTQGPLASTTPTCRIRWAKQLQPSQPVSPFLERPYRTPHTLSFRKSARHSGWDTAPGLPRALPSTCSCLVWFSSCPTQSPTQSSRSSLRSCRHCSASAASTSSVRRSRTAAARLHPSLRISQAQAREEGVQRSEFNKGSTNAVKQLSLGGARCESPAVA